MHGREEETWVLESDRSRLLFPSSEPVFSREKMPQNIQSTDKSSGLASRLANVVRTQFGVDLNSSPDSVSCWVTFLIPIQVLLLFPTR